MLACLTKDQQFSFDVCGKLPPSYDFKVWTLESFQYRMLDETKIFFPLVYTSQECLIYILLNISQANSLEPQIPNKLDPGE